MIHLNKQSGKVFVGTILEAAEAFFNAPVVDLTEPGEWEESSEQNQIKLLEDRLQKLETAMRAQADKNVGNYLMFCEIERRDRRHL
jgi:hypothetical protein